MIRRVVERADCEDLDLLRMVVGPVSSLHIDMHGRRY